MDGLLVILLVLAPVLIHLPNLIWFDLLLEKLAARRRPL